MDDRKAFSAMIYVLRTGIQWNALPKEMGASSTVHERYQKWERLELFEELWRAGLLEYDELEGIGWEWQALDGAMTKAPLGRGAIGKNPTDRAKMDPFGGDRRGANRPRLEIARGNLRWAGGGTPCSRGKNRSRTLSSSTCAWTRRSTTWRRCAKS